MLNPEASPVIFSHKNNKRALFRTSRRLSAPLGALGGKKSRRSAVQHFPNLRMCPH